MVEKFIKSKNHKVYIIGAGPGDPELITVKGLKALKEADCLLYDFLSPKELLKKTRKKCEKICVGKRNGFHLKKQSEINKLLYKKSLNYKKVIRLKGGDPFIFSRGHQEASYLRTKGINVEVIPGITSAIAAPESYSIPLTVKNEISSVAILTGRKKDVNARIDVPECRTLIYLMGVGNISNILKALYKSKRSVDTPCAFIEKATTEEARIVKGTISNIESKVKEFKVRAPAVLIVGEVVNFSQEKTYYDN